MSERKWHVSEIQNNDHQSDIRDDTYALVATVWHLDPCDPTEEEAMRAQKVAALPDLIEALKGLLRAEKRPFFTIEQTVAVVEAKDLLESLGEWE